MAINFSLFSFGHVLNELLVTPTGIWGRYGTIGLLFFSCKGDSSFLLVCVLCWSSYLCKPKSVFEIMEKHKGICSHCLTKIRRYGANIFQILQIGVNLKEEMTIAISGVVATMLCSTSVRQYPGKSGRALLSLVLTSLGKEKTQELQLSVICRADATPGDWCVNLWLGSKILVLFSRKCTWNIFTFLKCYRCQQARALLQIQCVASAVYRTVYGLIHQSWSNSFFSLCRSQKWECCLGEHAKNNHCIQ